MNCSRKLFRKAQLEGRRLHGEQKGNAEIISGIQKIDDPNNFFSGLARINKDLNKNNVRYTITSDGQVQLNSANIIQPSEFANVGRASRIEFLSNVPSRVLTAPVNRAAFDGRLSFLQNTISEIIPDPRIFVTSAIPFIQVRDMEQMTVLLMSYAEDVMRQIISILIRFLNDITEDIKEQLNIIFPYVSESIAALQFILSYISNMAADLGLDIPSVFTFFEDEVSVTETLIGLFRNWLSERMRYLDESERNEVLPQIQPVVRQNCEICDGCYYKVI